MTTHGSVHCEILRTSSFLLLASNPTSPLPDHHQPGLLVASQKVGYPGRLESLAQREIVRSVSHPKASSCTGLPAQLSVEPAADFRAFFLGREELLHGGLD